MGARPPNYSRQAHSSTSGIDFAAPWESVAEHGENLQNVLPGLKQKLQVVEEVDKQRLQGSTRMDTI